MEASNQQHRRRRQATPQGLVPLMPRRTHSQPLHSAGSLLTFVLLVHIITIVVAGIGQASPAVWATMGRQPLPYTAIKNNLQDMADDLLGLPESGVWVHEKVLHKVIGATSGAKFGPCDCMSCLIEGIDKGYCGNKRKDFIKSRQGTMTGFSNEGSDYGITYQVFGDDELFPSGMLDVDLIVGRERWFRSGEALVEVNVQL